MRSIRRLVILTAFVIAMGIILPVFAGTDTAESLKIDEAGTYTLTGSMYGAVVVDPGKGDVTLIFDDVSISAEGAPAIQALSGNALHIVLRSGSCNRITDSADDTQKAAIYTKVNTSFEGAGCLGITGNAGHGIIADGADITFMSGEYLICSSGSGIRCGTLNLNGGKVFVNTDAADLAEAKKINENGGLLLRSEATDVCSICSCCGKKTVKKNDSSKCEYTGCCRPTTDRPGYIAEGITSNSAGLLKPDLSNAAEIVFGASNNNVLIDNGGTYILNGKAGEGSLTVKQGTKGVILVFRDLDLTNSTGAAISINNGAEVQIVVDGKTVLKETSAKGTAIKAGDNTAVYVTGSGSMQIKSSYDGIAMGADSSLVIDGSEKIGIDAGNDGIVSKKDIAVLGGTLDISAKNDGVHADNVLTVGEKGGKGPDLTVSESAEGIEGAVVNIRGGRVDITAGEDGIEAEGDAKAPSVPAASVNISGGDVKVNAGGSAIDSDGNVNLEGGNIAIHSGKGKPCIDHDGELYADKDVNLDCDCGCRCNPDC